MAGDIQSQQRDELRQAAVNTSHDCTATGGGQRRRFTFARRPVGMRVEPIDDQDGIDRSNEAIAVDVETPQENTLADKIVAIPTAARETYLVNRCYISRRDRQLAAHASQETFLLATHGYNAQRPCSAAGMKLS